jgi:hypothetical protein
LDIVGIGAVNLFVKICNLHGAGLRVEKGGTESTDHFVDEGERVLPKDEIILRWGCTKLLYVVSEPLSCSYYRHDCFGTAVATVPLVT